MSTWLELTSLVVDGGFCGQVPLIRHACRAFVKFSELVHEPWKYRMVLAILMAFAPLNVFGITTYVWSD
jgi:hypothetical protein